MCSRGNLWLRAQTANGRCSVLHRDLKPANVLVSGGRVVVLDFGLAILKDASGPRSAELAGTLHYLAPELILGNAPSVASDLYAFGVMATEVFTGESPFASASSELHLARVLSEEPSLDGLSLPDGIRRILEQLLARDPHHRPDTAAAVAQSLADCVGIALPKESAQIRDSYLQSAAFVGRESELSTLRGALNQTQRGQGAMWLIGGESGVGKSRLLDELRTVALVRGAAVDRGQAVSEAGSAYQIFVDALRSCALSVTLSDLEASTLSSIVPDLSALIGRPISEPKAVDAQAARFRLLSTITDVLRRRSQPAVLILEDIHWAPDDALEVLHRLLVDADKYPLLVLASYRADERPRLPELLPGAKLLPLQRLPSRGMVALIESMLGTSDVRPELVSWLREQTEGNPFFLVEILRSLSEDADQLVDVAAQAALGQGRARLAGGMAMVVRRRLSRVPPASLALLRLAAVAGRRINLPLLRALGADLDTWIRDCADAAVLEIHDEYWHFAHDKLREGLLLDLDEASTRALHLQVAQALERSSDPSPELATSLAYHMEQAGQLPAAYRYALAAGEAAVARGALADARELLNRALRMEDGAQPATLDRVRVRRLLGATLLALGQIESCMRITEEGLTLLDIHLPATGLALGQNLLAAAAKQGATRIREAVGPLFAKESSRLPHAPALSQTERAKLDEAYALYSTHGEGALYLCADERLLCCALGCVNIADRTEDRAQRVFSYSVMAYTSSIVPLPALADLYLRKADPLRRQQMGTRVEYEFLRLRTAVFINQGRWTDALTDCEAAMAIAKSIGDDNALMFATQQRIWIALFCGQLDQALSHSVTLRAVAKRAQQAQFLAWANAYESAVQLRLGHPQAALTELAASMDMGRRAHDLFFELFALSHQAQASLALERFGDARAQADAALGLYQVTPMLAYGVLHAIHGVVDVCFALYQHAPQVIRQAQRARLSRAMRFQRKLAQHLVIAQPESLRAQARLTRSEGDSARAIRLDAQAQVLSSQLGLPVR